MFLLISVLLALTVIALIASGIVLWLWRKQRQERRAEDEHAARRRRIGYLAELVAGGERDAQFAPDVTARLHRFIEDLRAESQL